MKPNELLEDLEDLDNKGSGIYMIYCIPNGRAYIGQSTSIIRRWTDHKSNLNKRKANNDHLQSAWNKYGKDKFSFHVLELCDSRVLDDREQYYIDLIDPSYVFNSRLNVTKPKLEIELAQSKLPDDIKEGALQEYIRVAKETKSNRMGLESAQEWIKSKGYSMSISALRKMTDVNVNKVYISEIAEEIDIPDLEEGQCRIRLISETLLKRFINEDDKGDKANTDEMIKLSNALFRYIDLGIKIDVIRAKKTTTSTTNKEETGKIVIINGQE